MRIVTVPYYLDDDRELLVECAVYPEEAITWDHAGYPATVDVLSVFEGSNEVSPSVLTEMKPNWLARVKRDALNLMKEQERYG